MLFTKNSFLKKIIFKYAFPYFYFLAFVVTFLLLFAIKINDINYNFYLYYVDDVQFRNVSRRILELWVAPLCICGATLNIGLLALWLDSSLKIPFEWTALLVWVRNMLFTSLCKWIKPFSKMGHMFTIPMSTF